jgi:hypothetical protein
MDVDLDALAQEFNMDVDESLNVDDIIEIDVDTLSASEISDPDVVISTNINKANAILDRVINEINRSGMTPRLGEVASQLISTINQAAGQIYTKEFDFGSLRIKKKMLDLKEREVLLKERISGNGRGGTVNQNIIVTDRETVLRLLKENKETKLLEQNEGEGEYDGE